MNLLCTLFKGSTGTCRLVALYDGAFPVSLSCRWPSEIFPHAIMLYGM